METLLIKGGTLINRGERREADIFVRKGRIDRIDSSISAKADVEIDATGLFVFPGIIDDQVHFREPGLTHKADIFSESRAAVAGGVTSFMEMPNTKPPALTQELLEEKYRIAAHNSVANYSFFMGAGNDNIEEVLKTDAQNVCGVKVFMGSSTGNMLVDDAQVLEALFARCPMLIATHCEDEETIRRNSAAFRAQYGEDIPMKAHPVIRSVEACLKSSSLAVELAKRYNTRLHVLHLTTADELSLFRNDIPLSAKRITSEVCVHHLYFNADQYAELGSKIKCNPAIKGKDHQEALFEALLDDRLDVIATDHAPHTWEEKQQKYFDAPAGLPLVQHTLNVMLEFYHQGRISLERIVEKMCHAPAVCFSVQDRGFLDEGKWADIIVVDPDEAWTVNKGNIRAKCGWSPFEGHSFRGKVAATVVSGNLVWLYGQLLNDRPGKRLTFDRS